ncbi:MAG: SulP family inorganic anion transporter [Acidimicrobiia bacterium]|nr:SulP family inorganic anion transporter [Acidimicrobiia bacterium]
MTTNSSRPQPADLLAGFSVALLLIPQSLAYAQIAGMPPVTGLFASALPLIVFAPFASSPYLQTGPVTLTCLLTFATLHGAGFVSGNPDYIVMGGLLAVLVGVFRLLLGLLRAGWVAYLIVQPVLLGFTSAAATLILLSQLPKALGNSRAVPGSSTLTDATWSIGHPGTWHPSAVFLSIVTVVVMLGGRRIHRLFPGVALAVVIGLIYSAVTPDPGLVVGDPTGLPEGFPSLRLDLPWGSVGTLWVGALIIALIGFAEPAAIARVFATEDKTFWDANRELISQGLANITAGVSGAFPIGGSFSRSSVNRMAGARTRWSGGVTGLVVLAFLPFAGILDPLPQAVLGAVIIAAVLGLLNLRELFGLYRQSPTDAVLGWTTWVATLWLAPNVHWGVLIGLAATVGGQFLRPIRVGPTADGSEPATPSDEQRIVVDGLLWLGSHGRFERHMSEVLDDHPGRRIVVDLGPSSVTDPRLDELVDRLHARAQAHGGSVVLATSAVAVA